MARPLASSPSLATDLWDMAWGKPWPYQSTGKVSNADISPDGDDAMLTTEDESVDDSSPAPPALEYRCLRNIKMVIEACGGFPDQVQDVLVIRREYVLLRAMIEDGGSLGRVKKMTVTGQPGIGKTVFLLYLLLYRLEHQLPTAIHLSGDMFFLFDQNGVTRWPANGRGAMTRAYWALADSNHDITQPCRAFLTSHARVIQASSPRPHRLKEWIKQLHGKVIISDLPHPLEIVAIAKELKLDTSQAYRLVSKWGPCTRAVINTLSVPPEDRPAEEELLHDAAVMAADSVCTRPSAELDPIATGTSDSVGSAILFVRPFRSRNADGSGIQTSRAFTDIPTPYLLEIFKRSLQKWESSTARQLFNALSSHSLTRPGVAWHLETRTHACLFSGRRPLTIFRAPDEKSSMQPAHKLLEGTVTALERCGACASFYWFPSATNFPGIDGVLGNDTNVHAVQVIIAGKHRSPAAGLRKVWDNFDRSVRHKYAWHVVFISDAQELAAAHVDRFTDEMKNFTFGQSTVGVQVWGCVLPSE